LVFFKNIQNEPAPEKRAGFFIKEKNETNTKYKLVVVAQQLFTTVKRSNAIAHKAGKRLIESR